jgi:hypothetical protein
MIGKVILKFCQIEASFVRFHFNVYGQQGQLLAAFRAFSITLLKNFVGRLEIWAFV